MPEENYVVVNSTSPVVVNGAGPDGPAGNDTIIGNDQNNTLIGGGSNDSIVGGSGNESISGGGSGDRLSGNAGNDTIQGGGGSDAVYGGEGNDVLFGHLASTDTRTGPGVDTVRGGGGDDDIYGGTANDRLVGDDGDDYIFGNAGNDKIFGGLGADTLEGGAGDDFVWCKTSVGVSLDDGNDVVVFDSNSGRDNIYGFDDGDDRLGVRLDAGDGLDDVTFTVRGGAGGTTTIVTYGNSTIIVHNAVVDAGDLVQVG